MEHNGDQRQVTSGAAVREEREVGRIVEMPSGHCFRLRPAPLDLLVKMGKVPDGLVSLAAGAIMGDDAAPRKQEPTLEEVEAQVDFYNLVVTMAMVEPHVVESPEHDDEVSIDDIEFGDKLFIARLLFQPLRELESFRHEPAGDVVAVRLDEDDSDAIQPDDGNEQLGE